MCSRCPWGAPEALNAIEPYLDWIRAFDEPVWLLCLASHRESCAGVERFYGGGTGSRLYERRGSRWALAERPSGLRTALLHRHQRAALDRFLIQ